MTEFLPEGYICETDENRARLASPSLLRECAAAGTVLEAPCVVCDSGHNLIVDLGCMKGVIPREEGALGIAEGSTKDIALISRVNKPVCFVVTGFTVGESGENIAVLSRKKAQTDCMKRYIAKLSSGDVVPARVTHLEQFGCFVDIGRGIPSLIPIDLISVSRISHPSDRFRVGQDIRAVVKSVESGRVCLSHKELLGTWEQNARLFKAGETVTGVIRSVEDYGVFVELTPNLAGLAEPFDGAAPNLCASVYIKAIIPEKMKIKLIIVSVSDSGCRDKELSYFINAGHISEWNYSCEGCGKIIRTEFL